ncbi:uncharacterized protein LOC109799806 [Cajanus cajan]|uniref:uncharacterized protein LOC109799806 n=1 Tax=Cajanus cajan TaxID=3821 RepID=UPI00098DD33F|nr:uncharacterized protein LOC109799806 [Cajanus cajan]
MFVFKLVGDPFPSFVLRASFVQQGLLIVNKQTGGEGGKRTGELVAGDVEVDEAITSGESVSNVAEVFVGGEIQVLKRSGSGEVAFAGDFVSFQRQVVEEPRDECWP